MGWCNEYSFQGDGGNNQCATSPVSSLKAREFVDVETKRRLQG